MPSVFDTAILPRFTELCNVGCETRLATNSYCRDLTVGPNGEVSANLIIALCASCEKKIIVPVQLCVLSTGFVEVSPETAQVCSSFPQLFPNQLQKSDDKVESDTSNNISQEECRPCAPTNCFEPVGTVSNVSNCNTCGTCNTCQPSCPPTPPICRS